jgi:hypothetical protein
MPSNAPTFEFAGKITGIPAGTDAAPSPILEIFPANANLAHFTGAPTDVSIFPRLIKFDIQLLTAVASDFIITTTATRGIPALSGGVPLFTYPGFRVGGPSSPTGHSSPPEATNTPNCPIVVVGKGATATGWSVNPVIDQYGFGGQFWTAAHPYEPTLGRISLPATVGSRDVVEWPEDLFTQQIVSTGSVPGLLSGRSFVLWGVGGGAGPGDIILRFRWQEVSLDLP